jgi:hypothetical protein
MTLCFGCDDAPIGAHNCTREGCGCALCGIFIAEAVPGVTVYQGPIPAREVSAEAREIAVRHVRDINTWEETRRLRAALAAEIDALCVKAANGALEQAAVLVETRWHPKLGWTCAAIRALKGKP